MTTPSDLQAEPIDVDKLRLDDENPRLATATEDTDSQDEIVRTLWVEESVNEVADSIARNGFYKWEPLLVVPAKQKGKYTVVEGNRRLAAVRLLREPTLRQKLKVSEPPQVSAKDLIKLDTLPCLVFGEREELWAYLGFRHINGTKPWDSFSKAKYVAHVHDEYGVSLAEIADRIGDRHATVSRLYRGYSVLDQGERQAHFSKENRTANKFYFSHLYTATDQAEYQHFLGIDSGVDPKANPVPKSKTKELRELLTWLYGDKAAGKEPVVKTQNPDLNRLREVIGKRPALDALRAGRPLDIAYAISLGDSQRFLSSISLAKEELTTAAGTVANGYRGDVEPFETVQDIVNLATSIMEQMRAKRATKGKG